MEYAILLNILIGLVVLVAVWYFVVPYAVSEGFIGIGPEPPAEVKVSPVPKAEAMRQIQKNLDQETGLLKDLEPYYEKLVQIAAGAKVVDPSAPDMKAQAEKKKPEVRQEIENETAGACIPLHDILAALNTIKNNTQLTPEAKLVISYKVLPASVESYRTTIVYLNKKAIELYKYFTELGGKGSPTAAVQGSSAASMNIKMEGFASCGSLSNKSLNALEGFASCGRLEGFVGSPLSKDITLNSAAMQAKGSLNNIIGAYLKQQADQEPVAAPITDKTIQDLYHVSNTRIRLSTEYDLRGPLYLDMKNNFDRLNTLIEQVQNPPDTVFAGITEGKSPQAALEGFLGLIPEDNYAFLKYSL